MSKWLRLIVLISFMVAIRLPGINEPVSGWHAWRQADTAAIARNFAEEDMNILHPRVDWRGETAGQIESEFPIVSWASAALIRLGSPENAALRLPSIVTSVLGVLAVLALGSRWCGPRVGWIAALTYGLLPFGVYFGRVPMPEVTMLAASAGGLLFADVWATDRKLGSLIAATACLALAALLKLPTLYMGLPLIAVFVVRGRPGVFRDVRPWIAACVLLTTVAAWYLHAWHWGQRSGLSFGIWGAGTDKLLRFDLLSDPGFYDSVFLFNLIERVLTYGGFVGVVAGMILLRNSQIGRVLVAWWIALLAYVVVASGGVKAHDYYLMPFMLPAALSIAVTVDAALKPGRRWWTRAAIGIVALATVVLSIDRAAQFHAKERPDSPLVEVTERLREVASRDELLAVVHDGGPHFLFLSGLKGWTLSAGTLEALADRQPAAPITWLAIDTSRIERQRLLDPVRDRLQDPEPMIVVTPFEVYRLRAP